MVENTVRSIPARKNWQEKGEYGKLFTRISGQNTSGVGREGKFALESCGYKPCATAYHRTLSTPPVESTVTRCTTWIPPSMATTEIHGVDAVSRLLVRPRVARTKEEYGIRGGISREEKDGGGQTLGNAACTNCILVFFVLERDSEETFTWSMLARCSFLADRVSSRYDFPESTQSGSFDLAEGNRGRLPCGFARTREIIKLWACHENEWNLSILYLYIHGIEQKVALEIGYIFKTIYDFVSKTSDREKERYFFSVFFYHSVDQSKIKRK